MPITPPVAAMPRRCSSLRLRWWSRSARAHEWVATTVPCRQLEHVVDRRRREVRHVEQDPEPLELGDRAHAARGQAASGRLVRRALGEQRARPVRERHHPHAEAVDDREQLDVAADPLRALERDDERDLAVAQRGIDLASASAERHLRRLRRLALDQLELEQRRAQRRLRHLGRDVDRQHLNVDTAGASLGHPVLAPVTLGALRAEAAIPEQQEDGEVVVRVDDDGVAMDVVRVQAASTLTCAA